MKWVMRGFSSDGCIKPGEYFGYWLFSIGTWAAALALAFVSTLSADALAPLFAVFMIAAAVSTPWIGIAALIKRFRDAGLSFGWFFLLIVPFGGLVIFVLALSAESKNETPLTDTYDPTHRRPELPSWLNRKEESAP